MIDDGIPRDPLIADGEPTEKQEVSNAQLRHDIGIGMDFEMFRRSDMGRFLASRAKADIDNFHIELEDPELPSERTEQIRFEIRCRRQWAEWIREVIDVGVAAQAEANSRGNL